ncbi:unnamed protein product [Ectocarpus fasciculatus]
MMVSSLEAVMWKWLNWCWDRSGRDMTAARLRGKSGRPGCMQIWTAVVHTVGTAAAVMPFRLSSPLLDTTKNWPLTSLLHFYACDMRAPLEKLPFLAIRSLSARRINPEL